MVKVDFEKKLKPLCKPPPKEMAVVDVPAMKFLMIDGYRLDGKHHEIYLSDPRRTSPERLKTVIRQPVGHRKA